MEDILLFLAITVPWAVAVIVRTLSDNRTRRHIVEQGASEEVARALFAAQPRGGAWAARWGLVAVSLGLGLLVVQRLPYTFEDPATYGVLLLSGGVGLLLHGLLQGLFGWRRWPAGRPSPAE